MRRSALVLLAAGSTLVALGCRRELAVAPTPIAVGDARILSATDTFVLRVEIAETPRQHGVGLKRRAELPESTGMIFLFQDEQPRGTAFWMHRTSIPLSVAFLDAQGVIREIRDMEPCRSRFPLWCPRYRASVPFRAVLEVNRGYFERRRLGVGVRVTLTRGP